MGEISLPGFSPMRSDCVIPLKNSGRDPGGKELEIVISS